MTNFSRFLPGPLACAMLAAACLAFASLTTSAAEITFAPTASVGGKTLQLNGVGIRKATVFRVKVYHAGLYLEAPSSDADAILASSQLKRIEMHFVHDVSSSKLKDAWREGIAKNCKQGCDKLESALQKLDAAMVDIKDGDMMEYAFYPDRVELRIKGQSAGPILGADFSRAMLAVWLGAEPPNGDLKDGLLGKLKN